MDIPRINSPLRDIFAWFDALNADEGHFSSSNDICTPMHCVKEMVDAVPAELWQRENLRVLDCCCGNGNFHAYIQSKAPLAALHFNEINARRIRNARRFFGPRIRITQRDFLTFSEAEHQYDLVVSNPPYAKFCAGAEGEKRASKNHNLSRAFIRKAMEITKPGGYILFIVPDNWMSFADRNILPSLMSGYQFLHLDIHGAKKWFPRVGSSFTWFLMRKTANRNSFTIANHYKLRDEQTARLEPGSKFIPLYYSETVRRLMNKTIAAELPGYNMETTSDLHRTTKRDLISPLPDSKHPYRLIHTPKQTVYASRPHKYQEGWKVFLSLSDRYGTFIDNCGMTQSVAFVRCKSRREAEKIKRELDTPVYRAINNLTRYGNFNNIRVLQNFPRLEHIRLTRAEEKLVNHFAQAM